MSYLGDTSGNLKQDAHVFIWDSWNILYSDFLSEFF